MKQQLLEMVQVTVLFHTFPSDVFNFVWSYRKGNGRQNRSSKNLRGLSYVPPCPLHTMNYPKKPGFNLYQSRHCACITYSVKTWFFKILSVCLIKLIFFLSDEVFADAVNAGEKKKIQRKATKWLENRNKKNALKKMNSVGSSGEDGIQMDPQNSTDTEISIQIEATDTNDISDQTQLDSTDTTQVIPTDSTQGKPTDSTDGSKDPHMSSTDQPMLSTDPSVEANDPQMRSTDPSVDSIDPAEVATDRKEMFSPDPVLVYPEIRLNPIPTEQLQAIPEQLR